MAVKDGNPTTFAPELLSELTRWERSFTDSIYERRLARVGAGKRRYPDDESAASVARRTTVEGVALTGMMLVWIPSQVSAICLSGTFWDGGWWIVGLAVFGPVTVVLGVVTGLRCRRVNRYFLEHFADSLDRSVFKPGFDPAVPAREESSGTVAPSSVEVGNPATFAPDLLATLTSLERTRVALAYAARVVKIGQGKDKYPDDEPAASVARRSVLQGVSSAGWLVALPFTASFAYSTVRFLRDGTPGWLTADAVVAILLLGVWAIFRMRRRKVEGYFAERHDPGPEG